MHMWGVSDGLGLVPSQPKYDVINNMFMTNFYTLVKHIILLCK